METSTDDKVVIANLAPVREDDLVGSRLKAGSVLRDVGKLIADEGRNGTPVSLLAGKTRADKSPSGLIVVIPVGIDDSDVAVSEGLALSLEGVVHLIGRGKTGGTCIGISWHDWSFQTGNTTYRHR